ncbi:MAG: hypothetical protein PHF13_02110, partial [Acholeplasmataceae bacterium]|nr:hypothetical protein [Acholeplasmataceae bacterium]
PVNWNDKDEDIYRFIKLLVNLKHKDSSKELDSIKVSLFAKDGLKIEKGNLIGLFNFGNKPLSIDIENNKYMNLLGNNIINGQNISLSEPLILKKNEN